LVVDGALDGLDAATRERLFPNVFGEDAPWTLVAVTDDPEVLARCTRRMQLAEGRLAEEAA
jgi:predicted ABC-type transport system involved in lysophospholipase L1 biosynthesis ATPase subunit